MKYVHLMIVVASILTACAGVSGRQVSTYKLYDNFEDAIANADSVFLFYLTAEDSLADLSKLGKLKQLRRLVIGNNRNKQLPDELFRLEYLEDLSIATNTQLDLSKELMRLSDLPNLRRLDLRYLQLSSVPCEVSGLKLLRFLDVSHNQVDRVCEDVLGLDSLESINLEFNNIDTLFVAGGSNAKIRELRLGGNPNMNFSQVIAEISTVASLRKVVMGSHVIRAIDDSVETSIPPEIRLLSSIEELYMQNMNICNIPSEITGLVNLKVLDMSFNKIQKLPAAIGALRNLEALELTRNNISSVPDTIRNLANLKGLMLSLNPISDEEALRIQKMLPECNVLWDGKRKFLEKQGR